ncbi:DUF6345 domain-containing protein [Leptolyngbya ohadii]|uniref:DUF6345 domain-containing protein n=1 Tax=Leptolyngbya ohadii TaxID=1962290 RepID=UPI000B59B598|nr:DUF6345 domain-containing protein [Leptolyngbya ohadii]
MKTLPVYRLATPPHPGLGRVHDLATRLFSVENYSLHETNGRQSLRSTTQTIEVDRESGAIWAADQAELWNPEAKPQLPNDEEARRIADEFIRQNHLVSAAERSDQFVVEPLGVAGSYVATFDKHKKQRQDRQIDSRVSYGVRMLVKDPETGTSLRVPVISGVGKQAVTLGHAGRVIAYSNTFRPIDAIETQAAYVPREVADKQFKQLTSHLNIEGFDATLAYACAKSPNQNQFLYPVWAYRARASVKGREFPLRIITLPATEFAPPSPPSERRPKRTKRDIPRSLEVAGRRRGLLDVDPPYEAGASWIGKIGGLGGSEKNAQGFVDGLRNAGWKINFNWGDCNAWETDWHENDDDYVDAADFVFYTGHAGGDGWMLVNPGNCATDYLISPEVGASPENPGDIWGQQDLEWIIVAACGPLEDDILSKPGGGNVLQRWDGAFDGLHLLMGYGSVTFDNVEEGGRVVKYAREGQRLVDAWFRAAQEIQPSENGEQAPYGPKVYVGAMWANKSGQPSPVNDHLWGCGSVAPDPTPADGFTCMWVPC